MNTDNSKTQILIVDDQPNNLRLLAGILKGHGYSVRSLQKGEAVYLSVLNSPPELILLDIIMPDLDGYAVCEQLKADDRTAQIPIIFISALHDSDEKVKAFSVGGVDYVTKPFDERELLLRVKTHLTIQAAQQQIEEQNRQLQQEIADRKRAEEQIKTALEEKRVLLQELYHRTKNNLAVVSSMLSIQADMIRDPQVQQIFHDTQHRIKAMALVHQMLYRSESLSRIHMGEYIQDLGEQLLLSYGMADKVSLLVEIDDIYFLIDTAIPCGMIFNELLSNAMKYAFPEDMTGEIRIKIDRTAQGMIEMDVRDNGVGMAEDFDFRSEKTFGVQNVVSLVEHQLRGTISFGANNGVRCVIRFEEPFYRERM